MLNALLCREIAHWRRLVAQFSEDRKQQNLPSGRRDRVHQLRVISRRCREGFLLAGYNSQELSRFNHTLGFTRDVEMLCALLAKDQHPVLEQRRLIRFFERRCNVMTRQLARRLRSASVRRLGSSLALRAQRLELDRADEKKAARTALRKAYRRIHRLWKKRQKHPKRTYLHRLRRAIRRLRYVGEIAAPIDGRRLKQLSERATRWQRLLGDHQDALIAQRLLNTVRHRQARDLIKEFKAMERKTAARFWKRWRRSGWHKLQARIQKAIASLGSQN